MVTISFSIMGILLFITKVLVSITAISGVVALVAKLFEPEAVKEYHCGDVFPREVRPDNIWTPICKYAGSIAEFTGSILFIGAIIFVLYWFICIIWFGKMIIF